MFRISTITLLALITLMSCSDKRLNDKDTQIQQLNDQIAHMRETNGSLLDRLSDLSVINQTEAKSIQASLESLGRQNEYIQVLAERIHQKDSLNMALMVNLKRSLDDINDEDISVEVRGSAVYVSIADELLYRSGSADVSSAAMGVLSKVASIINDHEQLNVLVEGHTDDLPISNQRYRDNWDLSVQRATSVVRILQDDYYVDPSRLTAAGRSSYVPREDNATKQGRSKNRRTEIIITPRLDQFFELLEAPELMG